MSNKMWGGRFSDRPDAIMEEINVSIDVDRHLYAQDIAASKAHAAMLAEQGIISASDARNIGKGLDTILGEMVTPLPSTIEITARYQRSFTEQLFGVEASLADLFEPEVEAITIHA